MTSRQEQESSIYLEPTDVSQPFAWAHLGIVYPGEVIVADRWRQEWGSPLEEDKYFRILILRSRQILPGDYIHDSRIAACIPGAAPGRQQRDVDRELRVLRETRAKYGALEAPGRAVVHHAFDQREEDLRDKLMAAEAQRYAEGVIQSSSSFTGTPLREIFSGNRPEDWCKRIASVLLSWAYPTLPLNSPLLPQDLKSEDALRVLASILDQTGSEGMALTQLGPGLGLSTPEAPSRFDPGDCAVFRRILDKFDQSKGELSWREIHRILSHADGLTTPFATLYLIAFVYNGSPEVELGLMPNHGLSLLDGRRLFSTRLTRERIPLLVWRDDVTEKLVSLRLPGAVSWNDALPYTLCLTPDLREIGKNEDASVQEQVLSQVLAHLLSRVERCQQIVGEFSRLLGGANEDVQTTLERLQGLSVSRDYMEVYKQSRHYFGSPAGLSERLHLLDRLEALGQFLPEVGWARGYLDGAVVEGGQEELSLIRFALIQGLSLPHLLEDPRGWQSFMGQFDQFRRDYGRVYRAHHQEYHRRSLLLRTGLEDTATRLEALARLNSIFELGEPVGEELGEEHQRLYKGIRVCDESPEDLDLDLKSQCFTCSLALGEELPQEEVELLDRKLERSLMAQNRRLSLVLVERILHGQTDQRLEKFLKVVQASDLSSLADVLNDEMAIFIQRLLQAP